MVIQMTLKTKTQQWKPLALLLEAEHRGCLHPFLLAKEFSFSWIFHSLLSPEKKTQLLLDGDLESQQGPASSGGFWQVWSGWRPHSCTWVLKTRKNGMKLCQSWGKEKHRLGLSWVRKKMHKPHQIPSALAGETEHPDEKGYLQKHLFLPIPEWHPSFWLTNLSGSRHVRR